MSAAAMWAELVARWVPDDPFPADADAERYYGVKHDIVAGLHQLKPVTSIVEIGVRAGYSAFAMLSAAPAARYLGIDPDRGEWGGIAGYFDRAAKTLEGFSVEFLRADSQQLLSLPDDFTVAHIDGDHSYQGALRDLRLCAPFCEAMIVDDYDFIAPVRHAANEFAMSNARHWAAQYITDGGWRGNLLLIRRPKQEGAPA